MHVLDEKHHFSLTVIFYALCIEEGVLTTAQRQQFTCHHLKMTM